MKNAITAKRIQQALSDMNMKPQELADKSGVSKASISQYVNGAHAPSNISSGKMAKVLNVDPLWLMGFDTPMRPDYDVIYTVGNAQFITEVTKRTNDKHFVEMLSKYMSLLDINKKSVNDMIDFLYSKEHPEED